VAARVHRVRRAHGVRASRRPRGPHVEALVASRPCRSRT
jgi:hypothetical protein